MVIDAPTVGAGTAPPDIAGLMHDRLGMFIHFGLYALAARHEWVQSFERIHPDDYRRYFERFDPDLFDDASEIRYAETDPHQEAQNTSMGGLPPGTLTLTLPVRPPAVAVPVVELFLS